MLNGMIKGSDLRNFFTHGDEDVKKWRFSKRIRQYPK